MNWHNPDYLMTAKEASEHYRYMKPHAVYCGDQRIEATEWADYILECAEVDHGFIRYITHKATPEELAAIPAARAEYEKREQERRAEKERAMIASGDAYRCPHCGEIHRLKEYEELVSTPGVYFCPDCLDDVTLDTLEHIASPEEKKAHAAETLAAARADLESRKDRSAWDRGVTEYALELLGELEEAIAGGWFDPDNLAAPKMVARQFLNGAADWSAYSWGGCSLIYDGDIAERLCSPSELKKTRGGERRPNGREEWLDVQARALYQAARRLYCAIKRALDLREVC